MIGSATRRRLIGQSAYIALALLILFVRLMPLHPGRITLPGPDLALCLTLAWVLRRPEQIPALIIAAVFLIEDALLLRPIGLWAALVVMGSEAVRTREPRWREQPFVVEWLRVSVLMAVMMLANWLAMAVVLMPLPPLGLLVLHLLATVAAYPFVVLVAHFIGLRRKSPKEHGTAG